MWTKREQYMGAGFVAVGIGAIIAAYVLTQPKEMKVTVRPGNEFVRVTTADWQGNQIDQKTFDTKVITPDYKEQFDGTVYVPMAFNGSIVVEVL